MEGQAHDGELLRRRHASRHGFEACNYLIATDVEMNVLPGYRFANWEAGYGDMKAVPDFATLRRIPWLEKTAMVICDLVEEVDGREVPVEGVTARDPQATSSRKAAKLRAYVVKTGAELEFFLFRDSFEEAAVEGVPRPHAGLQHDPGLPHPPNDEG